MWTKSVLLFGAGAVLLLLPLQFLPLEYLYALPVSAPVGVPAIWSGLGPAVKFWFALLGAALVHDYVVSRHDRSWVRPFASVLNPAPNPKDGSVTQTSDVLRVDVSCHCSWMLKIDRNTLGARLLARAGASIATGDRELDALVVVQADDPDGVRDWLGKPPVRNRVLALFREHNVASVSLRDEGSIVRAEFLAPNPFAQPERDAAAITELMSALAETLDRAVDYDGMQQSPPVD
jgi:hypothetical protein